MATLNYPSVVVNHGVFRKDQYDKWKLKREKRKFNLSPESKEKIVTVIKRTN